MPQRAEKTRWNEAHKTLEVKLQENTNLPLHITVENIPSFNMTIFTRGKISSFPDQWPLNQN